PGPPSLEAYRDLLSPRLAGLFARSAGMAAAAALLALLLGAPLAFLFETRRLPFRPLLRLAALAPLLFPPYMQVAVWKPVLGAPALHEGWVQPAAAVLVFGLSYAPLVFFFASQGIRGISGDLLDAARAGGASEARVALRVVLPLAAPALALGTAV